MRPTRASRPHASWISSSDAAGRGEALGVDQEAFEVSRDHRKQVPVESQRSEHPRRGDREDARRDAHDDERREHPRNEGGQRQRRRRRRDDLDPADRDASGDHARGRSTRRVRADRGTSSPLSTTASGERAVHRAERHLRRRAEERGGEPERQGERLGAVRVRSRARARRRDRAVALRARFLDVRLRRRPSRDADADADADAFFAFFASSAFFCRFAASSE